MHIKINNRFLKKIACPDIDVVDPAVVVGDGVVGEVEGVVGGVIVGVVGAIVVF